ncbi:tachylectin-2-like [Dendropsophus ebraccatus]|uniref:tachylectin-2-like n=1 Tax=Dendropsophus ebraccatus TaxID=150705 RepID=UPI0038315DF2
MADLDTLLLCVTKDYEIQVGLPPRHAQDSFKKRANFVGKVDQISNLACSPDGEVFCVRSGDLYRGPLTTEKDVDWFTVAERVGISEWDRVKCLVFHPDGDLYCTTNDGEMYKGPPPDNENVPWLYDRATRIAKGWQEYLIWFFDPEGNMYGVVGDSLYKGAPPTDENVKWKTTMVGIQGWQRLTAFISFTKDNKLWAKDHYNGNFYRGDKQSSENASYLYSAECIGWKYDIYPFMFFTKDKTIRSIISFDFLVDEGSATSEKPEVVEKILYDNRSKYATLRHDYKIKKTVKNVSSFSHEHGFTFELGVETTFETGIPFLVEEQLTVSMNMSTTHNWNFETVNETETSFETGTTVELEPGNAVWVVSTVKQAQLNVPYKALVRTMFGSEVEIRGKWTGVSHFRIYCEQIDFDK